MSWESGHLILDDLEKLLARFVAFPSDHARATVALWVVHAHAVEAFESTPRLALLSPEKGSGKTRTLEVIALVVPNPIHAINISVAALYRLVEDRQPTLLLDEADTYLGLTVAKQHEELRGLINAGHRRGATVYRGEVSGKAVKVVEFPAYAACALAGLGDLPDTILDRSVIVPMKRRAPTEQIEPFRERMVRDHAEALRDRIAGWTAEHVDELRDHWPEMPEGITDRAADVWEPLVAIADRAGGEWPERARAAAVAINAARLERDPSLGILLLTDCRRLFAAHGTDRLTTAALVEALVDLDESPWGDLRGKPIDARGVANRLRKYGVRPGNHRFDDTILRGYRAEDFHDAWERYLEPIADVVDVVDVADPQGEREADGDVVVPEGEGGYDLLSIQGNSSLSSPGDPLHPLHPQQKDDLPDEFDSWVARLPAGEARMVDQLVADLDARLVDDVTLEPYPPETR